MLGIGTAGLADELTADTRLEFGDIQPHILTVGAQPTVGSVTPGPVALGCIRKQGEQVMRTKPVKRIPAWPLLQLQSPDLSLSSFLGFRF